MGQEYGVTGTLNTLLVGVQKMVYQFWNTCLVVFYINKAKRVFTI